MVRVIMAQVYFDEDRHGPEGGWVWLVMHPYRDYEKRHRGIAGSLSAAVWLCEEVLGIVEKTAEEK